VFTYAAMQAVNALISSQGILTQGNVWWVRPISGSDINDGKSPATAFATLTAALAAATAGQNDVVLLCAESNSASGTTAYQSAALAWNKDLVHLIGVNAGPLYSQRSRIAFSAAYVGATDLFDLTANGCLISGIEFFMGVASANPTGCMTVSGERNHFVRCHIAGMGNTANDIAGAYSLQLKGAEENFFEDCTIGQDTVSLSAAANSVLLFTAGTAACTRNWFRNCRFELYAGAAAECLFVRGGGSGNLDREQVFEDCLFLNSIASGATTLTHGMAVATGGGVVLLTGAKTGLFGASGWNANSGVVYATGGVQPTNTTWGLATAITS
jgi:hypothetical protein